MFAESVTYPAAFAAGLLSFFSPCVLPLIPAYFAFISGYSVDKLTEDRALRSKVVGVTISFVVGFSTVFVLMGASASFLGSLLVGHRHWIRILGGAVVIVLGLHISGIFRIRALEAEKRIQTRKQPLDWAGTFLVGMAFGAGWSPCIGPLLGSILIIAGAQESVWEGVGLLAVYSAGMAIPFLVLSLAVHKILHFLKRATVLMRYVNTAAGILLILLGLALILGKFTL